MLEYKGVPIRAASGLHETCFEIVQNVLSPGGRVLDIAAGAGAFTKRLLEAGYEVVANDIDQGAWVLKNVQKFSFDLNQSLDYPLFGAQFDLVVAMEVIEHLENPTKLLRDCRKLLGPGGKILISTPNVLDIDSRFIYLRKGELYHFSPQSYFATGHMVILPKWLLELLFDKAGLEILYSKFGGTHSYNNWGFRNILVSLLKRAFSLLMKTKHKDELPSNYIVYLLEPKD